MDEAKFVKIPVPNITLDEVFKAQGADYSKRPPRQSTIELHSEILLEAGKFVEPIFIWREVDILGIVAQTVQLKEGFDLTSPLLAKMCRDAEKLIFSAITIGNALEERIAFYNETGQLLKAFAMDAVGTVYITKASTVAFRDLEEHYSKNGRNMTFPMGPGHSYWPKLEDMKTIFHFLNLNNSDLRLTESNLILPRKSAAMVMGVGQDLAETHGKTHCSFCSLQATCPLSQS